MIYCDNCFEYHLEFKGCSPDCNNCRIFKLIESLDSQENIVIQKDGVEIEEE